MLLKQLIDYCNAAVILNIKNSTNALIYSGQKRQLRDEKLLNSEVEEFGPDGDILIIYVKGE